MVLFGESRGESHRQAEEAKQALQVPVMFSYARVSKKKKEKKFGPPPTKAAGTVSPLRGGRRILSAIEVVSASRSMIYITGRSRVFIPFLCAV